MALGFPVLPRFDEDWSVSAAAALEEPSRRAMYDYIRQARRPVTREEAAAQLGISRKLAAFHLDKLVELGLLVARTGFPNGERRVGRAPKLYEPAGAVIKVVIPAREPDVMAQILLDAVTTLRADERPDEAVTRVGQAHGNARGSAERERVRPGRLGVERAFALAQALLRQCGFEPAAGADGVVRLNNCPFHPLAVRHRELVCGINRAYVAGMLDGLGATALTAVLAPRPGFCCVEVRPASD